MTTLADEIGRRSNGRVTFDAHRRRLRLVLPGGRHEDRTMTEAELRRWLQRLLFSVNREPAPGTDSTQLAIELLIETLEADLAAESGRVPTLLVVGRDPLEGLQAVADDRHLRRARPGVGRDHPGQRRVQLQGGDQVVAQERHDQAGHQRDAEP